ncbi:MAG: outer membrane beta-barrel protein [Azoarcus sp.]|nr:outer membrane beta-barrel protein [Azoarcus sp.]
MSNSKQHGLVVLLGGFVTLFGVQGTPAFAAEGDAFKFSASQMFSWDSNLYRTKHDAESEWMSTTSAGANFDKEYGRQVVHAGLSVSRTLFQSNSELNSTSPDARFRWDWRVGDHWSGVLGYSYGESFVGFDNLGADERESHVMRRLARFDAGANYWFHPDWAVGVSGATVRNRYRDGNAYRRNDEYDMREANLNLTYRPSTGNRIVFSLRDEEGQYPERKKEDGSLRDWQQRDARLSGEWQLTGVTRLSGYIGYTQREYDYASGRDFHGLTGRIGVNWTPTPKAIVNLAWRREIGADQDQVSNYAVTHSWTLQPTWVVTDKIRLGATLRYLQRDYRGTSPVACSGICQLRDEHTESYGVHLQYLPTSYFDLALGFQYDERGSDSKLLSEYRDYRARTAWLSGNFTF